MENNLQKQASINGRVLAIDYGKKYIGLAISDSHQIAISSIPYIKNKQPDTLQNITNIIRQYHPQNIVLGFPYSNQSDTFNNIQIEITNFYNFLKKKFIGIHIHLIDESFSTIQARYIYSQNYSKKIKNAKDRRKMKRKIDTISAKIILEKFLEQ